MLKRPFFSKPSVDTRSLSVSLELMREDILRRILVGAIPLGLFAYFSALPDRLAQKNWGVIAAFSLAITGLIVIALVRKIPYLARALVFLAALAGVGITTLLADGLHGSGRVYLLALPFIAGLLLGYRAGFSALFFSLAAFAGIGWMMLQGRLPAPSLPTESVNLSFQSWLVAFASFALVSVVVTSSQIMILRGLERSLNQSRALSSSLDAERAQLEHRVLERTQDLERRLLQLRTTAEIIRSLGSYLDPAVLLQRVAEITRVRFNLYYVGVFIVDEQGENAILQAGTGEEGKKMLAEGHSLPVDDTSMIGWCIGHRQARIALDVGYEAVRFNNPHLPLTRSELALPMLGTKQVIGALTVQSAEPQAFDRDDIAVLQMIADSLATALENARLFQQVQQTLDELRRYNQQYIRDAWREVVEEFEVQSESGATIEPGSDGSLEFPLVLREQEIGRLLLELDNPELRPEDRAFVEAVTNQAALALENVRLLERTQRQASYERLVTEITRKVQSSTDIDSILRIAVSELGQILDASEGVIRLHVAALEQDQPTARASDFSKSEELHT